MDLESASFLYEDLSMVDISYINHLNQLEAAKRNSRGLYPLPSSCASSSCDLISDSNKKQPRLSAWKKKNASSVPGNVKNRAILAVPVDRNERITAFWRAIRRTKQRVTSALRFDAKNGAWERI